MLAYLTALLKNQLCDVGQAEKAETPNMVIV